jgi:lipid A 3-O-deacylase
MLRRASLALSGLLAFLALSGLPASAQGRDVAFRLGPTEVLGDEPSYIEMGVGVFDPFGFEGERGTTAAGQLQLRWGRKVWFIGPAIGVMANIDGGVMGYGGIYADVAYGRVVFTPQFGAGGYSEGHSKDLGGVTEFRTELGVAYQFDDGTRLGGRIVHVSNAGLHHSNPGEEELYLTYALPFP